MENNSIQQQNNFEEQEIDLIALAARLWGKRKFIIKVIGIFAALGLLIGIITPVEYTAKCVVMPETKGGAFSASSLGGLGSLAVMAGINLGSSQGGDILSPAMYESLMKNVNLCKELVQVPLYFEKYGGEVKILDYYTKKQYEEFSFGKTFRKYTIGLPGTIRGIFGDSADEDIVESNVGEPYNLEAFTSKELTASAQVSQQIQITTDSKNGSVVIKAVMRDPVAAAQLVAAVQNLLQKYIIEIKLQRAEINYNFIKERYSEAKEIFEQKQKAYALYQDGNRNQITALSKAKGEQIKTEYEVASSLFNELNTQLVQAEMKIKEDIPILTVVEPVTVPLYKSKPNGTMIFCIFIFIGFIFGCGYVLVSSWLHDLVLGMRSLKI